MGYLECGKCRRYYKLHEGASLEDFTHCSCGGILTYTESIEGLEHPQEDSENLMEHPTAESAENPAKTSSITTEKKAEIKFKNTTNNFKNHEKATKVKKSNIMEEKNQTKQLSNIGLVLMFIGLFFLIFAFFYPFLLIGSMADNPDGILALFIQTIWIYIISIILMMIGGFIFVIANIGKTGKRKKVKSRVLAKNMNELPGSYTLFQNVRIPKTRSLIGQVIIGPNGIFIIQNRKYKGNFIIRDDEWWRVKGNRRTKAISSPGKLIKMNSIHLKRFLNLHNINIDYGWITPIVSAPHDQYTMEEKPKNYHLIPPEDVSKFIINQNKNMDQELMMRSIALIASCSS